MGGGGCAGLGGRCTTAPGVRGKGGRPRSGRPWSLARPVLQEWPFRCVLIPRINHYNMQYNSGGLSAFSQADALYTPHGNICRGMRVG